MQHDEVIWHIIRHNHCSYMAKIETESFCRNPYNVTGLCNRSSCPLANSRYATIRDHDGVFYLYMKTIERAHMPNKLWERVKLPRDYDKALDIIDKHMMFWPELLLHKTKQRLTKMTQMQIRMRKLALKTREKVMSMPRKQTKRDARRLEKAEKAAVIDKKIEEELLERLRKGVYDKIYDIDSDVYNLNQKTWNKIFNEHEFEEELEEAPEVEYVELDEEIEEEEDMEDFGYGVGSADDGRVGLDEDGDDEDGDDDDGEDIVKADKKRSRRESGVATKAKKKPTVLVEVEHEDGNDRQKQKAVL